MNIAYNILGNATLCFLYYLPKGNSCSFRLAFCLLALSINLLGLFLNLENFFFKDMIGSFDGYATKASFLLFWVLLFFFNLEKKDEKSSSAFLLWIPFVSLFQHEYIYINMFVFILFLNLINSWKREKALKNIYILVVIMTVIQFLLLDIGKHQISYAFDYLIFDQIFHLANVNILVAIIALCMLSIIAVEKKGSPVCFFVKLAFPVFIMRVSQQLELGDTLLFMSYLVIFLVTVVIIPFTRFDMTLYLFVVSLAFTMDKQSIDFLPFYYLAGLILGETVNFIEKKWHILIKVAGGLSLMPFINPFVTNIFNNFDKIGFIAAIIFILGYVKLLISFFEPKEQP